MVLDLLVGDDELVRIPIVLLGGVVKDEGTVREKHEMAPVIMSDHGVHIAVLKDLGNGRGGKVGVAIPLEVDDAADDIACGVCSAELVHSKRSGTDMIAIASNISRALCNIREALHGSSCVKSADSIEVVVLPLNVSVDNLLGDLGDEALGVAGSLDSSAHGPLELGSLGIGHGHGCIDALGHVGSIVLVHWFTKNTFGIFNT